MMNNLMRDSMNIATNHRLADIGESIATNTADGRKNSTISISKSIEEK